MRVRLWFIILLFAGVLLVGLISLPFGIFLPWDDVFGDGGVADNLLNVFAYGLLVFLILLPAALGGVALIWQPGRESPSPEALAGSRERKRAPQSAGRPAGYSVWKLAVGVLLVGFAYMLTREILTSETPFPTSREDAARRAAEP